MNASVSYAHARQNLKSAFDQVCQDHTSLLVERRNGGNVVILSEESFTSLEETAYLLKSPKNAQRLLEALGRAKEQRALFPGTKALSDALGV